MVRTETPETDSHVFSTMPRQFTKENNNLLNKQSWGHWIFWKKGGEKKRKPERIGNLHIGIKTFKNAEENIRGRRDASKLRTLADLSEDLGSIPSTHTADHNHLQF